MLVFIYFDMEQIVPGIFGGGKFKCITVRKAQFDMHNDEELLNIENEKVKSFLQSWRVQYNY